MLTDTVALKEDQLQVVTDSAGDMPADPTSALGLYWQDTRFLSRFTLQINGWRPLLLSHSTNKHYIATFQLINPPFQSSSGETVKRQTISIRRSRFVTGRALYERIGFLNCNRFDIDLDVSIGFGGDFRDMFAVREFAAQPGERVVRSDVGESAVRLSYRGRDDVLREMVVRFDRTPNELAAHGARFTVRLAPQEVWSVVVRVEVLGSEGESAWESFDAVVEQLAMSYRGWDAECTSIATDNELFDREVLRASRYDVRTLLERTPQGLIPDAGVPWYAVPFGRDAIITALQTLLYNPRIAEGTLRFLAAHLGTEVDPYREEEPGKVMHELRRGELAQLGEVPHTPYYGTVDATPLFLVLLGETMEWTGSTGLLDDLWPAAQRAVEWIDRYGDVDGDGYVEYEAHRPGGVLNQGWKDSVDAVQYENGDRARQPIALVEVQGYVYAAKCAMAALARRRGDAGAAERWQREADGLRERFNRDFWMPEHGFYALALDADKRQVQAITSNPGHCLWSGICDVKKARLVAERLMEPDMFSGWGLRTLSSLSPNYNPMSYHNGSVWPHDTAIAALGLRRYGFTSAALQLVEALLEAGFRMPDGRLPELFCGFQRDQRFNSRPAAYAISCSPQAWAAGAPFMLLQTALDLRPDSRAGTVTASPILPNTFGRVALRGMVVGQERVDVDAHAGEVVVRRSTQPAA